MCFKISREDLEKKLKINPNDKYKVRLNLPVFKSIDELMAFDKKFFIDNPETNQYVRPVTKFDLNDIIEHTEKINYVLVKQITPDIRVRAYFETLTMLN